MFDLTSKGFMIFFGMTAVFYLLGYIGIIIKRVIIPIYLNHKYGMPIEISVVKETIQGVLVSLLVLFVVFLMLYYVCWHIKQMQ